MRNKESFKALIVSLNRCKDMNVLKLTIEMNLHDHTLSEQQRSDLLHLQQLKSLDVIHVFTSEMLGLHKEAELLRERLKQKATRFPDLKKAA